VTLSSVQLGTAASQKRADLLKAASFRPVANGYIYRPPKPWIFGRPDHYFVSETQRDAIVDILVPPSPGKTAASRLTKVMVFSLLAFVVTLLATSMLLLFSTQYPALITAGMAAAAVMVTLLAVAVGTLHRLATLHLASLQPILASAVKTNERISNDDVLWASRTGGDSKSTRRKWFITASINGISSAAFLAFAYLSWHANEGFFSYMQSFFIIAASALFGFQAAFNCYCALSDHLPGAARRIERLCKRAILIGALSFVAVALVYGGLLASGVIQPDLAAARARYARSAMDGDAEAMSRLAAQFRDGRGGPQDYVKAREWYEKAAATGDAPAMFWLGWLHQKGLGGAQDFVKAREWFEKAAAKGDGAAMSWLGANAHFGTGMAKDYAQARAWYEKAATAGNSSCMNNLGTIYRDGLGVQQDYVKAREWFEKAVAAGSAPSMNELGAMYVNGWGVARDLGKAQAWYEKAAAAGQLDGMQHLAVLLDSGEAAPADPKRAAHLLLNSAHLGHPWSKTVLGGPLLIFAPATRTEIKRELTELGQYHGDIDDVWNDEARAAVASYLKLPS
jgi:TPR repeat protein